MIIPHVLGVEMSHPRLVQKCEAASFGIQSIGWFVRPTILCRKLICCTHGAIAIGSMNVAHERPWGAFPTKSRDDRRIRARIIYNDP